MFSSPSPALPRAMPHPLACASAMRLSGWGRCGVCALNVRVLCQNYPQMLNFVIQIGKMDNSFDIHDYKLSDRERDFDKALRPLSFDDFSGQDKIVDNLRIFVKAA